MTRRIKRLSNAEYELQQAVHAISGDYSFEDAKKFRALYTDLTHLAAENPARCKRYAPELKHTTNTRYFKVKYRGFCYAFVFTFDDDELIITDVYDTRKGEWFENRP
jgi:hypothetical protein